ncbi:MAG: tetratricopeptide repeat protein [Pyrinomonadaceae bacterium]
MKKDLLLLMAMAIALSVSIVLVRASDARRTNLSTQPSEEPLYVNPATAKHMALAFNGLAADWYWMRSLQYVGGKVVAFEDTHPESFRLTDLDLHLLPSLLRMSAALDPQFIAPYEYGAMLLPEVSPDDAIPLLNSGLAANPATWRLYHLLGYVYWQRHDYEKASDLYAKGGRLPGAPPWMAAMGARMKADGGSRDAAREMYRHLYDASNDPAVRDMVDKQLMRLQSLDDRDEIRNALNVYKARTGRCVSSWREIASELRAARLTVDAKSGAPIDPSATAYELIKNGCDVGLDINTKVPFR